VKCTNGGTSNNGPCGNPPAHNYFSCQGLRGLVATTAPNTISTSSPVVGNPAALRERPLATTQMRFALFVYRVPQQVLEFVESQRRRLPVQHRVAIRAYWPQIHHRVKPIGRSNFRQRL